MADHTLAGNCTRCEACALRREAADVDGFSRTAVPCNVCGGIGLVPRPADQIVAEEVAWTRRFYWPDFDRRTLGEALT